jgi:hypothetical protein
VGQLITEQICVIVVKALYRRSSTMMLDSSLDDRGGDEPGKSSASSSEHALPTGHLYRELLPHYSLADLEAAVRWLEIGDYVGYSGWGLSPKMAMHLTAKGIGLAETGALDADERRLVYQEDPYAAFVARQFRNEDFLLFQYIKDSVFAPIGIQALDGQVDGIEAFRGDILRKIRSARFFVCVLTRREQLQNGSFSSSVWLYQETGAAVALGKKPLILVEEGIGDHFAGELQKNYEYIPFSRTQYELPFQQVGRRVQSDLDANNIPLRRTLLI